MFGLVLGSFMESLSILALYVCLYVCMYYVCMYSYQPEGWLDPHTVPAPDAHTHTHTCTHIYLHAHMPMHSTPHTTTAGRTKPGVKWGRVASSFPPPYCTQPGNDEVHYLAKNTETHTLF
jgi:hypothetical protein